MSLLDVRRLRLIGLLDPTPSPTATTGAQSALVEEILADGPADRVGYALIFNAPHDPVPSHPRGWTLTTWPSCPGGWSTALAPRGAAVHAGPRVAKAVAVRVLNERGVPVDGWADPTDDDPTDSGGLTTFRARSSGPPLPRLPSPRAPDVPPAHRRPLSLPGATKTRR